MVVTIYYTNRRPHAESRNHCDDRGQRGDTATRSGRHARGMLFRPHRGDAFLGLGLGDRVSVTIMIYVSLRSGNLGRGADIRGHVTYTFSMRLGCGVICGRVGARHLRSSSRHVFSARSHANIPPATAAPVHAILTISPTACVDEPLIAS